MAAAVCPRPRHVCFARRLPALSVSDAGGRHRAAWCSVAPALAACPVGSLWTPAQGQPAFGGPATPRGQSLGVLCVGVQTASLGKQYASKGLGIRPQVAPWAGGAQPRRSMRGRERSSRLFHWAPRAGVGPDAVPHTREHGGRGPASDRSPSPPRGVMLGAETRLPGAPRASLPGCSVTRSVPPTGRGQHGRPPQPLLRHRAGPAAPPGDHPGPGRHGARAPHPVLQVHALQAHPHHLLPRRRLRGAVPAGGRRPPPLCPRACSVHAAIPRGSLRALQREGRCRGRPAHVPLVQAFSILKVKNEIREGTWPPESHLAPQWWSRIRTQL